jgi:hypothetical protein
MNINIRRKKWDVHIQKFSPKTLKGRLKDISVHDTTIQG